jgi:SAM-dependent methyltransferase
VQTQRDMPQLWFEDPDDFRRLRELLSRANYTDAAILEALAVTDISTPRATDLPPLLRRTRQGTTLDTLIRLFLIGVPAALDATRHALAPMALERWFQAGLLECQGGHVVALIKLLPHKGLVLAFDAPRELATGARSDFVMGIGSSTLTLANLAIRRRSRLTLDLGTGCGTQAFLAAAHSDQVFAVDRNPRACNFATFNAQLNGFTNIQCFAGDLFEPVRGRQFDLVLSNPPYVISPASRYLYRDSGMHGDQFCQRIVREVPSFLRAGGYCQILCNWAHYTGQGWQERLAGWFEGSGCDAWVMRSETRDASTYATVWIRGTEADNPAHVAELYDDWMTYYEREGIEAMSAGLITMRRRDGDTNWFCADDAPEKMLGPCGEAIARRFELRDFLANMREDRALLEARLWVAPEVRWDQQCEPSGATWQVVSSQLRLASGLVYSGNIDSYIASLVLRCNGQRPLRELLAELAIPLGGDLEGIAPECLEVTRRLIEHGFLLPAEWKTHLQAQEPQASSGPTSAYHPSLEG